MNESKLVGWHACTTPPLIGQWMRMVGDSIPWMTLFPNLGSWAGVEAWHGCGVDGCSQAEPHDHGAAQRAETADLNVAREHIDDLRAQLNISREHATNLRAELADRDKRIATLDRELRLAKRPATKPTKVETRYMMNAEIGRAFR